MDFINQRFLPTPNTAAYIVEKQQLLAIWEEVAPVDENPIVQHELQKTFLEAFLHYSDNEAFLKEHLDFTFGSWEVHVSKGIIKTAISASILTGILMAYDFPITLSSYALPLTIPLLFEIKKISLTKSEDGYLLNLHRTARFQPDQISPADIYDELPTSMKNTLPKMGFIDFCEKLYQVGYADKNSNGTYSLKGKKKKIKIRFK